MSSKSKHQLKMSEKNVKTGVHYYLNRNKQLIKEKEKSRVDIVGEAVRSLNLKRSEVDLDKVTYEVERLALRENKGGGGNKKLGKSLVKKGLNIYVGKMQKEGMKKSFQGDDDVFRKTKKNQKVASKM